MQSERQENELLKKLLCAPYPPPQNFDDESFFENFSDELLKKFGGSNLPHSGGEPSLLPPSLLLAQYLHIPPEPKITTFNSPILVRRDRAEQCLASFAHFRKHRPTHLSLIENTIKTGKDGSVFIFSKQNFDEQNSIGVRQASLQILNLDDYKNQSFLNNLEGIFPEALNTEWYFYSSNNIRNLFSTFNPAPSGSLYEPFEFKYKIPTQEGTHLLELIFGDNLQSYLPRIAQMVRLGCVVFCIPKIYSRQHPTEKRFEELGGGGCAFIIKEEINKGIIENLYVLSHKLCSTASSVYDISRVASTELAAKRIHDMVRCINHSLKNAITKEIPLNVTSDGVKRILLLEKITINAAVSINDIDNSEYGRIDWKVPELRGESIGRTVEQVLSDENFQLKVIDDSLIGRQVDARFPVIIIELGRNLAKRQPVGGPLAKILVVRNKENPRFATIKVTTKCSYVDAWKLYLRLSSSDDFRGIKFIATLAEGMIEDDGGSVSWTFVPTEINAQKNVEIISKKIGKTVVNAPASVFSEISPKQSDLLEMTFVAKDLASILD